MSSDEKHIQELIKISKSKGKQITREEAIVELERMRSIANIIIDKIITMSPQEREELEEKIKKEKLEKKLTRKSNSRAEL